MKIIHMLLQAVIMGVLIGLLIMSSGCGTSGFVVCMDDCYNQADGNKTVYDECAWECDNIHYPEENATLEEWMEMSS